MTSGGEKKSDAERALSLLGLCRRAGGVTAGTDGVLTAVRTKRRETAFVLIAADASPRTKKQITDKCAFYGVPCREIGADSGELAACIGLRSGCVSAAVQKKGPWEPLLDLLGGDGGSE